MKFENPGYLNETEILAKSDKPSKEHIILAQSQNLLASKYISIDDQNENGKTLLHIAAENGFKQVTQACTTFGANIEIKDKNGKTPLDLATEKEHFFIQVFLKANMPKTNQSASASKTAEPASTSEIKLDDTREVVDKLDNLGVSPDRKETKTSRKSGKESEFLPGLEGFFNKKPKAKGPKKGI